METEKHFIDLPKEEQERINENDIKEMVHYYGGWDEFMEVVNRLKDNAEEAAFERHFSRD
jgi:hypothetical protein